MVAVVLDHEGGKLAVQESEHHDVAFAHLVEHRHHVALAEGGALDGLHHTDVGDVAVGSDGVVVDVVAYVLYQTVVADSHIAQGGIAYARVLAEAGAHLNGTLEDAKADVAVEHHVVQIVGREIFAHAHGSPVFSLAAVEFQDINLLFA